MEQQNSALRSWLWAWVLSVSAGESCIALEHSARAGLVCFSRERAAVLLSLECEHGTLPPPNCHSSATQCRVSASHTQPRAAFLPYFCSKMACYSRVFGVFFAYFACHTFAKHLRKGRIVLKRKPLLLALLLAVLAGGCAFLFFQNARQSADAAHQQLLSKYGGEQVAICMARRNLEPGETVRARDVEVKHTLASLVPEGCFTTPDDIVDKTLTACVVKGEAFVKRRFVADDTAMRVPLGFVAISVPLRSSSVALELVKPGSRVNVYATGEQSSALLAQRVLVLASASANQKSESAGALASWVVVAVPQSKAQEFVSASKKTQLTVVLPSSDEGTNAPENASTKAPENAREHASTAAPENARINENAPARANAPASVPARTPVPAHAFAPLRAIYQQ